MAIRSPDANRSNLPAMPELKSTLPHPETPWNMSSDLFQRARNQSYNKPFRTCEVLNTDPEFKFVLKYFEHQKPPGFGIKRIVCVHNPIHTQSFESTVKNIEQEATNTFFAPQWQQEELKNERAKVIHRWKKQVAQFSPLEIASSSRGEDTLVEAKVLPLWHGSSHEKCESVCSSGFTFFGKHEFSSGNKGGSTDHGYFGSGIYFTNSAQYAALYSSEGIILLSWVTMREPYPVINDVPHPQKGTDMKKLGGKEHYQNYNAHYIPVASIKPDDPKCMNYYPCYKDQTPAWDEFVIFQTSQALPRFWIELGVDFPAPISLSTLEPPKDIKKPEFEPKTQPYENHPPLPQASSPILLSPPSSSAPHAIEKGQTISLEKGSKIQLISTIEVGDVEGHDFLCTLINKDILATYSSKNFSTDKFIQMWDIASGKCLNTIKSNSYVYALTSLKRGILAIGSSPDDSYIKLRDIPSGKLVKTFEAHTERVSVLTTLEGDILASGSRDKTIKLWDTTSYKRLNTLKGHSSGVNFLTSSKGILASASQDWSIKLWDIESGKCLTTIEYREIVYSLAILNGTVLAFPGKEGIVKLWDITSNKCINTLKDPEGRWINRFTTLPRGILAYASPEDTIKLWDTVADKCIQTLEGDPSGVRSLISNDDGILASVFKNNTIKLWG